MWFSSGRSPSPDPPATRRRPLSATVSAPLRRSNPKPPSSADVRSGSGTRSTTWSMSYSGPSPAPELVSPRPRPSGASKVARSGARRSTATSSGSFASAASRSVTRSTTRSSTPGSRGPSASNSVSLPLRASEPTSVNLSVRSMTCMPRWPVRKSARVSRSATHSATWSRAFVRMSSNVTQRPLGSPLKMSYEISNDPARLDRELIHRFLSEESYWAKGRSREVVDRSIDHSIPFGVCQGDGAQVGFARVVTDRCTFAWIADVFVVQEHRGRGLGKRIVEAVLAHPELQVMGRWFLGTADAHGLYEQFGFGPLQRTERFMAVETPIDRDSCASGGEQPAERVES